MALNSLEKFISRDTIKKINFQQSGWTRWTNHHPLKKSHRNRDKINGTLFCHRRLYGVSRGFSTRAILILLFIVPMSFLKACKPVRHDAISVALPDDRTNYRIAVGFEICARDDRFVKADRISLKPRGETEERGKCSDANRTRARSKPRSDCMYLGITRLPSRNWL